MFVLRFGARARHKAEACQSACWPFGQHLSVFGCLLIIVGSYDCA
jgi:hypothetical protein